MDLTSLLAHGDSVTLEDFELRGNQKAINYAYVRALLRNCSFASNLIDIQHLGGGTLYTDANISDLTLKGFRSPSVVQ